MFSKLSVKEPTDLLIEKLQNRVVPLVAAVLFCLLAVWVALSPAETRLGNIVKLVYVHGALVWVGLLTFTLSGLLGLVALIVRRRAWYRATWAAGRAALIVWIVYAISSMAVTGLTWGQLIAWNEPRVQASALVLLTALLLAIVAHTVDHPDFTAAVNLVMGIAIWIVVRQAEVIRHPVNPIGESGSSAIQLFYLLIVVTVAGLAATLFTWLWARAELEERKDRSRV
jgi:hypothetical protein